MKTNTQKAKMGGGKGQETVVGWWDCLWRGWVVTGGSEHLSGRSEQGLCGHREQGCYKEAYRGLGGGGVLRRQERRAVVRGTVSTSAPAELLRMGVLFR